MVAELGGTIGPLKQTLANDSLMRAGERYVLFLVPDARAGLSSIAALPHFTVVSLWIGKMQVIGDLISVNKSSPNVLRDLYEGVTVEQFKNAVRALGR